MTWYHSKTTGMGRFKLIFFHRGMINKIPLTHIARAALESESGTGFLRMGMISSKILTGSKRSVIPPKATQAFLETKSSTGENKKTDH